MYLTIGVWIFYSGGTNSNERVILIPAIYLDLNKNFIAKSRQNECVQTL